MADDDDDEAEVSPDELGKLLASDWVTCGTGVTRALFFTRVDNTEGGEERRSHAGVKQSVSTAPQVCTFSGQALSCTHGLPAQVADHVVHCGLVAQEDGPNHSVVDDLGAVPGDGRHAPQQEETLGHRQTMFTVSLSL